MPHRSLSYRLLILNRTGDVLRTEDIELRDDLDALALAERSCITHDVEIWQGTRLVAHVDHVTHEAGLPAAPEHRA